MLDDTEKYSAFDSPEGRLVLDLWDELIGERGVYELGFAKVRPPVPGYSDLEGLALIPALQDVMSGNLDGAAALTRASDQGDRILEANRT